MQTTPCDAEPAAEAVPYEVPVTQSAGPFSLRAMFAAGSCKPPVPQLLLIAALPAPSVEDTGAIPCAGKARVRRQCPAAQSAG
jgi:hypothetical protein